MFTEESRKCETQKGNFSPKIPSFFHHFWFDGLLDQHSFSKQILVQEENFMCFAEKGRTFYKPQTGIP